VRFSPAEIDELTANREHLGQTEQTMAVAGGLVEDVLGRIEGES
jgi:hypothetical protein